MGAVDLSCRWLHGVEAIVSEAAPASTSLWTAPSDVDDAELIEDVSLIPGDRYPLLGIDAGEEGATGTSAEAYRGLVPDRVTEWR